MKFMAISAIEPQNNERITTASTSLTSFGKSMLIQGSRNKLSSFNGTHIYATRARA